MSSRETMVASIPDIRDDNITEALRAIKNVLQVREGHIGDVLDQNVTIRDLKDLQIVVPGGVTTLTGGSKIPVRIPLPDDSYDPTKDFTTPPAPTGLTITSGMTSIYLSWDGASMRNFAYAEIWRGSVDVLGSAIRIATTITSQYADPVGRTSQTYYYWIRFVSEADVAGPYNGTAGTIGGTGLVGGVDLSPLIITADKIASGAIDLGGAKITGLLANANMAVITDPTKIADALISNTKLAELAVTAGKIASGAITLTKFASGLEPISIVASLPSTKSTETVVYNGKLYRWNGSAYTAAVASSDISGTISDAQVAGLSASKITGQLSNSQIADLSAAKLTGQITNTQISDDAISTPKLAAGAITSAKIAANTIVAGNIAAGAITATEIAAGTITSAKIAAGTIQASNIAAGTITGSLIAANTITGSNIVADTITAAQIAAGAIGASEIAAGAITAGKIATGSIIANDGVIANGAITNALIANAAIGSAQIADAAITSAKIGSLAVGNAAIQNGAITNAKIGDMAADKITTGTLTAAIGISSGYIYGGMSPNGNPLGSAQTGTGYFLGAYGGVNQFFIGSPTKNLVWNGSELTVKGVIYASAGSFTGSIYADSGYFRGSVNTGDYTGYGWPGATGQGAHLSSSGLLVGNANTGKYFQVTADGNVYAPGFSIVNGAASFTGAVTATSGSFSGNISANTFTTNSGRFTVYADGSVIADLIEVRRRNVVQTGTVTPTEIVSGGFAQDYGEGSPGFVNYPPGTFFTVNIGQFVLSDVYDSNFAGSTYNQPYKVQCNMSGPNLPNWTGSFGNTIQLTVFGEPSVVRTYSNAQNFPDDWRVVIKFSVMVKLISGSFDSFTIPAFTWALYKI